MPEPIALATWNFGPTATEAAWACLHPGGNSLDAVERGCCAVEDDPSVHTVGFGGLPDRTGQVSLDGSIMTSPSRCGAVAYVRRFNHPVSLARAVMEKTDHRMLCGEGAEAFAESCGFEPQPLLSDAARSRWEQWKQKHPDAARDPRHRWLNPANLEQQIDRPDPNEYHDTVGVLALDVAGHLAGACSTSGLPYKVGGRVGDSPIIGAGLYVHPTCGAAVATGTGELVLGHCSTFDVVQRMGGGASAADALTAALGSIVEHQQLESDHQVGLIALRPDGTWAAASLRPGFTVAVTDADGTRLVEPPAVLLPE